MYKIYKLTSKHSYEVYIGKTKQKIPERKSDHKSAFKKWVNGKISTEKRIKYCSSYEIIRFARDKQGSARNRFLVPPAGRVPDPARTRTECPFLQSQSAFSCSRKMKKKTKAKKKKTKARTIRCAKERGRR